MIGAMADGPDDSYARRAEKAGLSASRAAREGNCGEAIDDYAVAVSLHAADIEARHLAKGDAGSWRATQLAKQAIRNHCLVNERGRGLFGARARRGGKRR